MEYIIELLLLRIFEVKLVQDPDFTRLRAAFTDKNEGLLFSSLLSLPNDDILRTLNLDFFPFYAGILSEARKVWRGNLSDKVQDQLVLIEEVFSNSNFTNNVTSGNMAEIIGLVAELDSERLLKTDLLGDAIESALSETGGTKDIGLHRTPDHIREFMVGLAAPTFQSRLFDPTVGTGGFMFDAFEYVLEGVYREGHWPGPKSHPELAAWFKAWFERHPVPVPSIEVNTDFYRTGVGGIEYLGMVRKMAAINFYVRGLNPGNIRQGDALEKFGSEIRPNSKSIVLANPPFGAQRDKESYPNVWSEYPTESETTILFVKLMLELIKPGGVCGVIVSEGFLTWDQNSARALRRSLLEDCDLQAIISLPQGVFVSKGGQGPKTSILFFVKGRPTERVWFYKVTNDGYSMGTNRKPMTGCQLVEALDLFHTYVREGREPPESRHSFCIPAEWIKTLDPRIKDRIRAETRADMAVKEAEDRGRQETKWGIQVAAGKLSEAERARRLVQHAELWHGKTENEIARKIERAHLYSFNLANYRSGLTSEQLEAWRAFAANQVREAEPEDLLERRYRAVATAPIERLDELLSTLDPRHALELDWARDFLAAISIADYERYPHLKTLQDIIASQHKLPRVKLKNVCHYEKGRFPTQATSEGPYSMVVTAENRKSANDYQIDGEAVCIPLISSSGHGKASMNRIHYEKGRFAVANLLFALQPKDPADLSAKFLYYLLGTKVDQLFVPLMKGTANVGLKLEDAINVEIPLPPIEQQERIAVELEKLSRMQDSAKGFITDWDVDLFLSYDGDPMPLSEIIDVDAKIIKDLSLVSDLIYVGGEHIESGTGRLIISQTVAEAGIIGPSHPFRAGQVIYSKVRPNLRKCFFAEFNGVCSSDIYPYTVKSARVKAEYLAIVMASSWFAQQTQEIQERAGMPKVNREQLATIRIIVPNLEEQQRCVDKYICERLMITRLEASAEVYGKMIIEKITEIWEA